MTTVSVYDARASLSRLIDQVLSGQEVVITRKGRPVVRLVAVEGPPHGRRLGVLAGELDIPDEALLGPLPDDVLAAFHGDEAQAAADPLAR